MIPNGDMLHTLRIVYLNEIRSIQWSEQNQFDP